MAFGVPCAAPLAMLGMFAEIAQGARAAPLAMLGMLAKTAQGALCNATGYARHVRQNCARRPVHRPWPC